jgi:hypothetical protein
MQTILIVLLALFLFGAFPIWPHSAHWGYYPSISLGTALLVVLIVALVSKKRIV